MVVRVNNEAQIVEIWPYINPGAMLTFPPRSDPPPPPTPGGQPGTEEQARALSATWSRAMTSAELVARILDAAASDCLVHATNGDLGRIDLLDEQFAIVARAFPDVTVTFENAIVQGDRCVTQFQLNGTHRGPLGPAPATGLSLQSTGALVARVNDRGHAAEIWVYLAPGMGLIFPRSRPDGPGRV